MVFKKLKFCNRLCKNLITNLIKTIFIKCHSSLETKILCSIMHTFLKFFSWGQGSFFTPPFSQCIPPQYLYHCLPELLPVTPSMDFQKPKLHLFIVKVRELCCITGSLHLLQSIEKFFNGYSQTKYKDTNEYSVISCNSKQNKHTHL